MTEDRDIEKALASQKSYVTAAVITFVLYCVFYIPGLIFNILYIRDAQKTEALTGKKPSGYGCLVVLFVLGLLPLVGFALLIMMFLGIAGVGSLSQ